MRTTVIIATSMKRTEWLVTRSLNSVYNQKNVDESSISVSVIDDNEDGDEINNIIKEVYLLRRKLHIQQGEFPTQVMKNRRTQFMSGTGAWNTGVWDAYENYPHGFVSILDDDDEYLPNHLANCLNEVDKSTIAIFQWLYWLNDDCSEMHLPFSVNELVAKNFFIGNPGVQGSNMFFKTKYLIDIGGFDESLPNTTDRDLMIRLLWHFEKLRKTERLNIKVIENIGVIHHNHKQQKVNNGIKKHLGLDLFYRKYKTCFSEEDYHKSLARAEILFNYSPLRKSK